MTFETNMSAAARRHLVAGDILATDGRLDVAGYLYGIAAECAIKAMMIEAGMRLTSSNRNDPFYAHFPELRTILRDASQRRRSSTFLSFIQNDSFMNNWSIRMRYSDGKAIKREWVDAWKEQAHGAVSAIGT